MLAFAPRLARRSLATQCRTAPQTWLSQPRSANKQLLRGFTSTAPARSQPLPEGGGRDKAAVGVRLL